VRTKVLIAAIAALVVALPVASADAASFQNDRAQLLVSPSFNKALKKAKVKLSASNGATTSGLTVNLPLSSGTASLAPPIQGTLSLTGTIQLKGKKKVTLSSLSEVLSGATATLKSGSVGYFTQVTTGNLKPAADFTELDATGMATKLSAAGAKALNSKLKVKAFKKNMPVGKVRFNAFRQLTVTGGTSQVVLDQNTQSKLASCGVTTSPIAPATQSGNTLTFPVVNGQLDAKSILGTVGESGGIHLQGTSHSSDLTNLQFSLATSGAGVSAQASDQNGRRTPIGDLDLSQATFGKNLTATNGTATINGAVLKLNATAAGLLQVIYGCNTVHAGDPLGTVNISANVT